MRRSVFFIAVILAIQALVLRWQGRIWMCACGTLRFWVGDINSSENSQQITDWYTFSHIEHGFLFYALLWLVARKLPRLHRLVIAVAIEAGWEMLENSSIIIDRYRQTALANGYVGDSILNSLCDTLSMIGGFVFAGLSPIWLTCLLALISEAAMAFWIRDNLILNIIQLIHPVEFINRWQSRT